MISAEAFKDFYVWVKAQKIEIKGTFPGPVGYAKFLAGKVLELDPPKDIAKTAEAIKGLPDD